jgi:DNA polymerase-3 subunit delta
MQLAAGQLAQHLQRGLRRLYTLHGDEPLLVQEAADAIRAAARAPRASPSAACTPSPARISTGARCWPPGALSLFADKQIVEIRIPSGKPGKDGSAALQQLAEPRQGNDSTAHLVLLPRLDKATRSGAWFAALDAMA